MYGDVTAYTYSAQTGGVLVSNIFPPTLTSILKLIIKEKEEQRQLWIAMPATTRIIAASEINTKTNALIKDVHWLTLEQMLI
jgi:hypothetical protein